MKTALLIACLMLSGCMSVRLGPFSANSIGEQPQVDFASYTSADGTKILVTNYERREGGTLKAIVAALCGAAVGILADRGMDR